MPLSMCIQYIFANISGLGAYISKPIFALKPWVQAGRFEYHKSYNQKFFGGAYKGSRKLKRQDLSQKCSAWTDFILYTLGF